MRTDRSRPGDLQPALVAIGERAGLTVRDLGEGGEGPDRYALGIVARLLELDASRRVEDVKGRLQRVDATADPGEYERLTRDLFALEAYRRSLREQAMGEE